MKNKLKLTTSDICDALNIKKHRLRGWTQTLSPYCDHNLTARVARKYFVRDLLFFAAVKALEDDCSIGIASISKWAPKLHELLGTPLSKLHDQLLVFSTAGDVCFATSGTPATPGITLEFDLIREPIESYFDITEPKQQRELTFGLMGIK